MEYKICKRCLMDTTDSRISFDSNGFCNHCTRIINSEKKTSNRSIKTLKRKKIISKYDCIVGLSGGVDSCYLLYLLVKNGVKPLAIHFDSGWNSELSQKNIELLVQTLDVDLITYVCDWESMKNIQFSFLNSHVPNCDIPQDHAFVSILYKYAIKYKIRTIVTGHNSSSESILPTEWGYTSRDSTYIKSILKKNNTHKYLKKFPYTSSLILFLYSKIFPFKSPLEWIDYNKDEAKKLLIEKLGWIDYGGKHHESMFTKFFQSIYLPEKFGFDKRKAHLSSLIVSGQINREKAILELNEEIINKKERDKLIKYISNKLEISEIELTNIIKSDIKNSYKSFKFNPVIEYLREKRFHGIN